MRIAALIALAAAAAAAEPLDDLEARVGAADTPARAAAALVEGLRGEWAGELDAEGMQRLREVEKQALRKAAGADAEGAHAWCALEQARADEAEGDPADLPAWDQDTGTRSPAGRKLDRVRRGLRGATRAAFLVRRGGGTLTLDLAPVTLTWSDAGFTAACGDAAARADAPAAGDWHVVAARWEGAAVEVAVDGTRVLELAAGKGKFRAVGLSASGDAWLAAAAAEDTAPDGFPIGEWRGEYRYGSDASRGNSFVARLHEENGRILGTIKDGKDDPGTVDCISDVSGEWNAATGELRFEKTYRNDGHVIYYGGRVRAATGGMEGHWSWGGGSRDGTFGMRQVRSSD